MSILLGSCHTFLISLVSCLQLYARLKALSCGEPFGLNQQHNICTLRLNMYLLDWISSQRYPEHSLKMKTKPVTIFQMNFIPPSRHFLDLVTTQEMLYKLLHKH